LQERLDAAHLNLGRLDSVTTLLPDASLLLPMYVRKEAILSSQIEGNQTSLSELLLFEMEELPGVRVAGAAEVSNYVAAMRHGLTRITTDGWPVTRRLIQEVHATLLATGRGSHSRPGEFRRSQTWIGGSRPGDAHFVPPAWYDAERCMDDLERWINDQPERTSPLLKAAMAHVQFETIHPFLDGNGRIGRLLITLLFCAGGILREPLLSLSLYLKQRRREYYAMLDRVRSDGDWEAWLSFFVEGVSSNAEEAVHTARRLVARATEDRDRIRMLGRISGSALRVHHALTERPMGSASVLAIRAGLSLPTALSALGALENAGVVRELTGRQRRRIYSYESYLAIISEGTEPLTD
jgi:Fic family protein